MSSAEIIADVSVGLIPIVSGFVTSWGVNGVGSDAGERVAARPPSWVFGVAWTILYLLTGASWVASVRADRSHRLGTDVLFGTLCASLCAWIVVYSRGTAEARRYATWVLVVCVAAANAAWSLATHRSEIAGPLLGPLVAWLIFALMMNFGEVQLNSNAS